MAKKKVGGGQRYRKAPSRAASGAKDESADAAKPASQLKDDRLYRKAARKVLFRERVIKSGLAAKASVQKKSKAKKRAVDLASLGNFSGLSESLEAAAAKLSSSSKDTKLKHIPSKPKLNKRRQVVNVSEAARVQLVLQHPQYLANPIAAITNHLKSSLPPPPAPTPASAQQKNNSSQGKKKKKRKSAAMEL